MLYQFVIQLSFFWSIIEDLFQEFWYEWFPFLTISGKVSGENDEVAKSNKPTKEEL